MADVIHVIITFLDGTKEDFYTHHRYTASNGLVSWISKGETLSYPIVSIKKIVEK